MICRKTNFETKLEKAPEAAQSVSRSKTKNLQLEVM